MWSMTPSPNSAVVVNDPFAQFRQAPAAAPAAAAPLGGETVAAQRVRIQTAVAVELLTYQQLSYEADPNFNTLAWWKVNKQHFPYLAAIARLALAVPATSAPSERVFSVAGLIVNKARNNLQEVNVGMLVFLRNVFAFEKRYGIVL
jgi:hypothetical protein